jgi:hypothetical protein
MSAAKVRDSFGTFFEELRKLEAEPEARRGVSVPTRSAGFAESLVEKLPPPGRPRPLVELLGESGLGFTEFTSALNALRQRDLAVVHGAPGHELVELSSAGQRLAEGA